MLVKRNKNEILNPKNSYDIDVGKLTFSQMVILHLRDFIYMIFCKELFWKIVYRFDDLIKFLDPSIKRYIPLSYSDRVVWFEYIQKALVTIMTPKRNKKFIQTNIEKTILSFKKDLLELNSERGKYQGLMLDTLIGMRSYINIPILGAIEDNVFYLGQWFTNNLKMIADKYGIQYKRATNLSLLDALFWGINEKNARGIMDAITGLRIDNTQSEQTKNTHHKTYQSKSSRVEEALEFMELDESFTKSQLKKRYRLLAKKYHPDTSHDGPKIFQKLNEANEILTTYLKDKN